MITCGNLCGPLFKLSPNIHLFSEPEKQELKRGMGGGPFILCHYSLCECLATKSQTKKLRCPRALTLSALCPFSVACDPRALTKKCYPI